MVAEISVWNLGLEMDGVVPILPRRANGIAAIFVTEPENSNDWKLRGRLFPMIGKMCGDGWKAAVSEGFLQRKGKMHGQ